MPAKDFFEPTVDTDAEREATGRIRAVILIDGVEPGRVGDDVALLA